MTPRTCGPYTLLNELGVVFRPPASGPAATVEGVDPDLVSTEGTVDGGRFRFGAAHFEWLLRFAKPPTLDVTHPATALVDVEEGTTTYTLRGTSIAGASS